jgi:protocatechuate 3,4-dioxygenase beta subunit
MKNSNSDDERGPITRRLALGVLGAAGASTFVARGTARAASSDDVVLGSLTISPGSFEVPFDPAEAIHIARVTNATESITITPTTVLRGVTITVNGLPVRSGERSAPIALGTGINQITITVTDVTGAPLRTHTVVVAKTGASCVLVPSETAGPYPLSSILSDPSMVRSDITEGQIGVPLLLRLSLVNVNQGCAPISNAGVYIWQCNKDGGYSGYRGAPNGNFLGQTFLRGIQFTNGAGNVLFTTIYPGWYPGRITHIHVRIYLGGTSAPVSATTQIAFPIAATAAVNTSTLYVANGQNPIVNFSQDNVFSDSVDLQLATVTGDVTSGYEAALTIGIAG